MKLEPNTTVSHFRVLSELGKGGMGEVYLAQDTELDRKVAIKFLSEELSKDEDKVNRFVQEAKAASALNHPNILTVHEIGTWEDTRYIATEYIEGETLRDVLKRREPVPLNRVLKIGIQVAEALSAAHEAGIAHRDIKPENVMIRRDGYVKVLDFGLAKLTESRSKKAQISLEGKTKALVHTNPGVVMGTANYMSPEQASGKPTDPRTDLWSLGVVLYEMLSGRVPFEGKTVNHTIVSILETEPKLLENIPDELQRIVRKTLAKERDSRYQTAKDLLIDLKNLRRDLDIQGELERSVIPNTDAATAGGTSVSPATFGEAATAEGAQSTQNVTTASSLEYAVTQAKSHKLATSAVLILVLGVAAAATYFAFFSGSAGTIDSIAVMPFVNESGDPNVEYLSDGMAETLINDLSRIPKLNVKARSLVFRYKGKELAPGKLAAELGVQAILTGRVTKRGERLTLSVELIDGETENTIWGNKYERDASGLTALQSELARDVSERLASELSGEEAARMEKSQTNDPEAYQAYLRGRFYWNKRTGDDLRRAIREFKAAIDRDPDYALAYSGLADCYAIFSSYTGVPYSETVPQIRTYAEKALSLDPRLAAPHAALGSAYEHIWNWAEAEKEYKAALELDPNYPTTYHWYSLFLHYLGRHDEAGQMIMRGSELDPMSSVIAINVSDLYLFQGNTTAALEKLEKILELDPDFAPAHSSIGDAYRILGRESESIAALEKSVELSNRAGFELGSLGFGYARTGRRSEALAVLKELEEKFSRQKAFGLDVAMVYVGLGDKDKAFEWLEADFRNKSGRLPIIRFFVHWESLRDDPRYDSLLKRMGLPVQD